MANKNLPEEEKQRLDSLVVSIKADIDAVTSAVRNQTVVPGLQTWTVHVDAEGSHLTAEEALASIVGNLQRVTRSFLVRPHGRRRGETSAHINVIADPVTYHIFNFTWPVQEVG